MEEKSAYVDIDGRAARRPARSQEEVERHRWLGFRDSLQKHKEHKGNTKRRICFVTCFIVINPTDFSLLLLFVIPLLLFVFVVNLRYSNPWTTGR